MKTIYLTLVVFTFFMVLFFTLQKIDEKRFIKRHALPKAKASADCGCLK